MSKTTATGELAERILDCALELAEARSWEAIRLHEVAAELGVELDDISECFQQKDDLVEAWFDRADHAMLTDAAADDYLKLSPIRRLHRSIMCWLRALASHRRITGQMLLYKLEPGHIHLQVLGLLRISRTVQWFLEAAHRDTRHVRRIVEEMAVSGMYLTTFAYWLRDDSANSQRSSDFLYSLLRRADWILGLNEERYVTSIQQDSSPEQDAT